MSHNGSSTSDAHDAASNDQSPNGQSSEDRSSTPWISVLPLVPADNQTSTSQVEHSPAHHSSGSCINRAPTNIDARIAQAERAQEQFFGAALLSHVTLFTVDLERTVTMLEGALVYDSESKWYIGENVYTVFDQLNSMVADGPFPPFLEPIEDILSGTAPESTQDYEIDGVMGCIMDIGRFNTHDNGPEVPAPQEHHHGADDAADTEGGAELESRVLENISHELRTPIAGVINTAELLLADDELGEEQRKLAENIHRSARALLTHANDVLDFFKTGPGAIDIEEIQFSLPAVIRDVFYLLSSSAESKGLALDFHMAAELEGDFKVMGDPGRLRQVLTSLLTHSIESTSRGYVKLSALKEDETSERATVKFVVEDSGRMIEGEVDDEISLGPTSNHTGRGLSISKSVVERMKGRITLVSSRGVGTTTTLWIPFNTPPCSQATVSTQSSIPLHASPAELGSSSANPETTLEGGSRSSWRESSSSRLLDMLKPREELPFTERGSILVLVAEDNPISQQFALACIRKLGFQAEAVWDGEEALDRIGAAITGCQPKPAVILMDKQMPEIDGYRCTHILRRHYPFRDFVCDVPIVALTASAIEGDKEKCKRVGMDDYMSKPATMSTLERVLVRWVTCGRTVIPFLGPSVPRPLDAATMSQMTETGFYRYTNCNRPDANCSAPETNDGVTADEQAPSVSETEEYMTASEAGEPLTSAFTVATESVRAFEALLAATSTASGLAATPTASNLAAPETEQSPPPSEVGEPLAAYESTDSEYDWASFNPLFCVLS